MKIKYRYVPRHKETGHFLDQYAQPVDDFMKAIRFAKPEEDYAKWLLGRFGPSDPHNYEAAPLKISYELEESNHVDTESTTQSY